MITSLSSSNFKCFKDISFECNKLNIFAGYNGRGKSSVLQELLLLSQSSGFGTGNLEKLHLNGDLIDLGDFDEILCNDKNVSVIFGIGTDDQQFKSVVLKYGLSDSDMKIGSLESCKINGTETSDVSSLYNSNIKHNNNNIYNGRHPRKIVFPALPVGFISLLRNIHFISANRVGPVDYVRKCEIPDVHKVGPKGFNVINILSSFNTPVYDMDLPHINTTTSTLRKLVSHWMNYIMSDSSGSVDLPDEKSSPVLYLKFSIEAATELAPINVGFGYSYILAIIVTALIAKSGSIVIIENPEAHLHGKAQSRLTELLAKMVCRGVQLFIETHSEHIVNGFRKEILKRNTILSSTDTNIYFFNQDYTVEKLNILPNGEITNWPEGFFDQELNDLAEIARLGAQII